MLIILGREIALEIRETTANEQMPLSGESDEQFAASKKQNNVLVRRAVQK